MVKDGSSSKILGVGAGSAPRIEQQHSTPLRCMLRYMHCAGSILRSIESI